MEEEKVIFRVKESIEIESENIYIYIYKEGCFVMKDESCCSVVWFCFSAAAAAAAFQSSYPHASNVIYLIGLGNQWMYGVSNSR